jgi:OOP family OmpA-OmpF porin
MYHTDPLNRDTDGDGLSDGDEIHRYKTDPLKVDTDMGGESDASEVRRGSNPLDPRDDRKPMKLEKGKSVVLEGVNYESGSARLTPSSENTLENVLAALRDVPDMTVEIAGYTDNAGKTSTNVTLSRRRAEAVKTWLVNRGISATRMTVHGYGSQDPIAPNNTVLGRAQNRRIEFHVK